MAMDLGEIIMVATGKGRKNATYSEKEMDSIKRLAKEVELLGEPQKTVVKSFFGIEQEKAGSLLDVAEKVGVTESEASDALIEAMRYLRIKLSCN